MSEPLLNVQGLKTYYFTSIGVVKAVDGVNLTVNKGELVGLVGESGCGKSCTALSIMRLVPIPGRIVGGNIIYKGRNLVKLREDEMRHIRGKEISIVFQDPSTFLNPLIKIGDQILENIFLHEWISPEQAKKRVIEVLNMVGMPNPERIVKFYPHELSGGMRQRAMIAMAIASNPSLLIADEPTTALDVTIQAQILELIKSLKEKLGLSILLITHDLGIVAELCDVVYVMYAGRIVESADVLTLFEKPKHPYTKGLLDSTLSIEEFKEIVSTIEGSVPNLINPPPGCRFHPRCKKAIDICEKKIPPEIEIEPKHKVSCWLYVK